MPFPIPFSALFKSKFIANQGLLKHSLVLPSLPESVLNPDGGSVSAPEFSHIPLKHRIVPEALPANHMFLSNLRLKTALPLNQVLKSGYMEHLSFLTGSVK